MDGPKVSYPALRYCLPFRNFLIKTISTGMPNCRIDNGLVYSTLLSNFVDEFHLQRYLLVVTVHRLLLIYTESVLPLTAGTRARFRFRSAAAYAERSQNGLATLQSEVRT